MNSAATSAGQISDELIRQIWGALLPWVELGILVAIGLVLFRLICSQIAQLWRSIWR